MCVWGGGGAEGKTQTFGVVNSEFMKEIVIWPTC